MDNDTEIFIEFLKSRGMSEDYARSESSYLIRQSPKAIDLVMERVVVIENWSKEQGD